MAHHILHTAEASEPETLGARGYSKDHRPDLNQMIVGVVVDGEGRPVCSEMWPGNTADVSVLVPEKFHPFAADELSVGEENFDRCGAKEL